MDRREAESALPVSTGIDGLDDILHGGLTARRIYLVAGSPGAGKTTLALQFLLEGRRRGERTLYITLSETIAELTASAQSHGWSLAGVEMREYVASEAALAAAAQLTMYPAAEVELGETLGSMLKEIESLRPQRVVIDALSEFRLLADTALRYRRQLLALKRFFIDRSCTVLLLDDRADRDHDTHVESIAHGVIVLEHSLTRYGGDRRQLRVQKLRGRDFRSGLHDYTIRTGGLVVFPRLVVADHASEFERRALPSGVAELDALLGGGPRMGTSTLLVGPAGVGKTTVAMQYAAAAAARGEHAAVFTFDELRGVLIDQMRSIGTDVDTFLERGSLNIEQVDPAALSPGEFAARVRQAVDVAGARIIVIDSLNGYLNAMPEEAFLTTQLHELLAYLGQRGAATLLIVAQQGFLGSQMTAPIDASYLADAIVLFRFFELRGEVRKAISVTKKRGSRHERTIRELCVDSQGLHVGEVLSNMHGVLTGTPELPPED